MSDDSSKHAPKTLEDIPTFTRKRRVDADIRKAKAIPMLLAGYTVKRIASEIGCSQETVKSWRRKDPLIKAILAGEAARTKQGTEEAIALLQAGAVGAAKALIEKAHAGDVQACKFVLQLAGVGNPDMHQTNVDNRKVVIQITDSKELEELARGHD